MICFRERRFPPFPGLCGPKPCPPTKTEHPAFALDERGWNRYNNIRFSGLLMSAGPCYCGSMAEHITRNDGVVGSIPTSSSKSEQASGRLLRLILSQRVRMLLLIVLPCGVPLASMRKTAYNVPYNLSVCGGILWNTLQCGRQQVSGRSLNGLRSNTARTDALQGPRSSVEPGRFHPMHKSRPTPEKPQKMHGATLLPHALSPLLPLVSRLPCL